MDTTCPRQSDRFRPKIRAASATLCVVPPVKSPFASLIFSRIVVRGQRQGLTTCQRNAPVSRSQSRPIKLARIRKAAVQRLESIKKSGPTTDGVFSINRVIGSLTPAIRQFSRGKFGAL